jgi:23S rRNA pseudouridine1911/1915/1917 synthase
VSSCRHRLIRPSTESIPLRIAYEDAAMLIVDKPAGLVVHQPWPRHRDLVHALVGRAEGALEGRSPALVGQDRPSAPSPPGSSWSRTATSKPGLQFGARSIEKPRAGRGAPPAPRGRIEAPVGRDPRDRQRMAVVGGGLDAVTEYEVLGSADGHSLLALHPLTGRTHQLRAHLAYLGLPIVGDVRYGGGIGPSGLERQFLHAARVTLDRPLDGRRLTAWSELPPDLGASLAASKIVTDRLPVGIGAAVVEDAD